MDPMQSLLLKGGNRSDRLGYRRCLTYRSVSGRYPTPS